MDVFGAGAAFGSIMDFMGGERANYANAKQAQNAMEHSELEAGRNRIMQAQMSNTAHEREVADLRKAGLNPILSSTRGGASTPAGSMAAGTVGPAQQNTMSSALRAGMDIARSRLEAKNLHEQNENIRADTQLKATAKALNAITYNRIVHEVDRERWNKVTAQHESEIMGHRLAGEKVEGDIDRSKYGQGIRHINRALPGVSTAVGAARALRGGALGTGIGH